MVYLPKNRVTPQFNPGRARWCEDHKRLECTKKRSRGRGQCHKLATRGTDACDMHAGTTRAIHKAQGEARVRISAWSPMGEAGDKPISAPVAVMSILQMSYLRLASYSELLRQQVANAKTHVDNPSEVDEPETSGLIGFRYGAAGKDGNVYVQTEEIRALVALEAAERDRIVRFAKTAHDMGISERMTQLAERWGDMVAEAVNSMLHALNLSPEQEAQVPILIQSHLGAIDMEALGVVEGKGKTAA